jgi:hypothetical protein
MAYSVVTVTLTAMIRHSLLERSRLNVKILFRGDDRATTSNSSFIPLDTILAKASCKI